MKWPAWIGRVAPPWKVPPYGRRCSFSLTTDLREVLPARFAPTAPSKQKGEDGTNNTLLNAAEEASVDLLFTTDQGIRCQQNLTGRKIALVVLTGTTKWSRVRLHLDRIAASVNAAATGMVTIFPASAEKRFAAAESIPKKRRPRTSKVPRQPWPLPPHSRESSRDAPSAARGGRVEGVAGGGDGAFHTHRGIRRKAFPGDMHCIYTVDACSIGTSTT